METLERKFLLVEAGAAEPRRAQSGDVSAGILDAAERAFPEFGYVGASMRAIAREAGVNQAMIAYYFGSKEGLLHAVIRRRASAINDRRLEALDALAARGGGSVEEIMQAFLEPMIELGMDEQRGGFAYVKLLAILTNSVDELSRRVIAENFDAVAMRFVQALMEAGNAISRSEAIRAYLLALGVGIATTGIDRRAVRMSAGGYDSADTEELVRTAVTFTSAGVRALMEKDCKKTQT